MYTFKTTTTIPSKVCLGVDLVVRKMTEGRRDDLRIKTGVPMAKIRLMSVELSALEKREDEEARARREEIIAEARRIENIDLVGIKITWGLKAINGLQNDADTALTVEDWKDWPSDLVAEALNIINLATGLTVEEAKNSSSDSTSGAQVEPPTNDTTAASA